ncbi:hypothetical protein RUMCAL_02348 [Ruminococcus callidus ATCC 27760]|uniref:Uncharacterized protein n=1 Tax=Ruminococcus callidus ATCC 27760 TaxID=411473 RepID=U2LSS3_9FIRM|nr:hypothetical protein RUMCAL_02348 [Ruminococcus callidus ATCC 27760]
MHRQRRKRCINLCGVAFMQCFPEYGSNNKPAVCRLVSFGL